MITLTKAQRQALKNVCDRSPQIKYRTIRKAVFPGSFGCVMVPWCGMYLGIEPDGHTHS